MLPQRLIRRTAMGPLLTLTLGLFAFSASAAPLDSLSDVVAVRAGTIHCVQNGTVYEGGATILIRAGKIVAVGKDIEIPGNAEIVDYGPDAVVVPGFVAAYSTYGSGPASRRTASPGTRAVDNYNPFNQYATGLAAGVTTAYITPSESRLISGVGALVKLGGDDPTKRVVNDAAAIHCSVDVLSRNTPGYWDPPLPINADNELGYAKPQLPATTMGAIVALNELVNAARQADGAAAAAAEYGSYAIDELAALIESKTPWRISAITENEIRAALRFAKESNLPLVLEKVHEGKLMAKEIAEAGVSVVYRVPFSPNIGSRNGGTSPDSRWADFDVPAALVKAGVRVAITSDNPSDLLFSAALVMRGGLSAEDALRAITLTPAQLSGSANRVGSIQAGKDADLCVLNAAPFSGYASVLATWIDGEVSWKAASATSSSTVLEVDELHVGDGEVMRPGQILIQDGRIAEVAERVSHPMGASVVRAKSAMPGIIDAFGHLGLEGARNVPATDFDMTSIIAPGDAVDRRVARHGITTVVMTPRGSSREGAPVIAYKPAASDYDDQIVDKLAAVRLNWGESNPQAAGAGVKGILSRAVDYRSKWEAYRKAMAAYTPPVASVAKDDDKEEEAEEEEAKPAPAAKKSKKKKKEPEVIAPDPITGRWIATIGTGEEAKEEDSKEKQEDDKKGDDKDEDKEDEKSKDDKQDEDKAEAEEAPAAPVETFKMRLFFEAKSGSGKVTGNLRCPQVSPGLVQVVGQWDREAKTLSLNGLGESGWVELKADYKEKKFSGTISGGGVELNFEAKRTSAEHLDAGRAERRRKTAAEVVAPKGQPKAPSKEPRLEPYLRAMQGDLAVVVEVNREDAILDCVATFEKYGIKPVLFGAADSHLVAKKIKGRVAGILLDTRIRRYEAKSGANFRTPYSSLQSIGIPVAFHSGAEEGAIDLPIIAAYAVANGMSPAGALRALTSDAASMMAIGDRVGLLKAGMDADVLLLDGAPLAPGTSVVRTWVAGEEIR